MTFSDSEVYTEALTSLPSGKTNRMIDRYGAENFLVVHFNFKMKPKDIIAILSRGIFLDGESFQFVGCSSSGLKKRSCYLMRGTVNEVKRIRDVECGQFTNAASIPKKLKGIGLLFSNAIPTGIEVRNDDIKITDDIMSVDGCYNFTDGCGAIGSELHKLVIEGAKINDMLPEGYIPSVLQIRLKGYKGVVTLDPALEKHGILIRKSMIKFESGTRPFSQVWLCNYSKPYSVGYLNQQYIMLLSGLGVPDEILLKKQRDYYEQMRFLKQNPKVRFEQLCISGQHVLATRVGCHNDRRVQEELSQIQKKFLMKISKLRIQIQDSRTAFGVCDTSEVLEYGECFFRPTINGQPCTISGEVIVAKNPCYFLGDVRVLTAVSGSRVKHLCHLIDCIVFPTKGKRPHPDEITGSDLDGDEYFVCWDEELSIGKLRNPEDFLALAKASTSRSSRWSSCIEYVANQVNMMGLLNSHYLYWAETKGVQSTECQELGQLFSRSVDASKTGDKFVVPKHLIPPRCRSVAESTAVWKRMELVATEFSEQFTESVIQSADPSFSAKFIAKILQSKIRKIPEFDLLTMLKKWCYSQELTESECMKKLVELSKHINFGKLTLEQKLDALELGIPVEMVTNALTTTQLLTAEMMRQFSLTDPHNRWCFYFHAASAEFDWDDLLTAVSTYPESLVVFKLSSGVIFALHFLTKMKTGDYQLEAGSIVGYFFSAKFKLMRRHVLGSTFSIDFNTDFLQLYRQGVRRNTFVWIRSKVLKLSALAETDFNRISIDLPTFQKDILRKYNHPTINKEQVDALEVYVMSGTEEPTYYDRLLSNLQCDNLDSLEDDEEEEVEEIPRKPEKEGESTVPHAGASLIKCLRVCARDGRLDEFSVILQSILTSDERDRLAPELGDALHVLLSVFVKKFAHLRQPDMQLDKLVPVLVPLQFAICSAKSCLLLLHRVSLLQSLEVTRRVGDIVLSCIELGSTSEYLEVLLHWEWWYFLPEPLANSLAGTLYTLSQSLLPDKPQAPHSHIATLCRARDAQELPTELKGMLEEYVHFYSYLHHCSFLDEAHSLRSWDTDSSAGPITKLKVCDPANPHPELDTEEEEQSGDEGTGKPTPHRKLEFHRSKGVSSRLDGYVVISFMSSDGSVPVAYGLITEASRQPTNIVVKVPEPIPVCIERSIQSCRGHWQLHSVGNVTSFVRGIKAMSLLAKNGPMATSLASIIVHPEGAVYGDISTATCTQSVRNPPNPAVESFEQTQPEPVKLNSLYNSREALDLNSKQKEAVMSSLDHSLTLIHGPPGTGKTRIACEIVCRYLARKGADAIDVQAKVLVAAETNMAVDNLARQLMHQQVHVIRIGSKEQTSDDIYSRISLESLVARDSESKRNYIDRKIALKILRDADVVATTCAGAGDSILNGFKFPFIIIDEATQVKEPVSLVAITKKCQQLTLIGDPEQLAPFNLSSHGPNCSSAPSVEKLAITLFHRLQRVLPSVVLEEQYRMSSQLVKFPSSKFYGGKLVCSPSIEERLPNFELRSQQCPIDFINVVSSKESHVGTSFKNDPEADTVVAVVKYLLDNNVSPLEMTVLTPYKKQVQCLIEKLSRSVSKVEVTTIDNFQGKENDVIIFTMVRSNVLGDLHFIAKRNRINVLLTRAKHCVIGVGSMPTLEKIDLWKDWLQEANVLSSDCQYQEKLSVYHSNSKTNPRHHSQPSSAQHGGSGRHSGVNRDWQHSDSYSQSRALQYHNEAGGSGSQQHGGSSWQQSGARGDRSQQHGGGSWQHSGARGSGSQQLGGSSQQQHGGSSGHHSGARSSGSRQHGGSSQQQQQHGGSSCSSQQLGLQ